MSNRFPVTGRSGYLVSRPDGWHYVNPIEERPLGVRVLDQAAVEQFFGPGAVLEDHAVRVPLKADA